MDWTTGLRPISSPLLCTLHKNKFTTNTYMISNSFVSSMKPVLIYSMPK